jgi:5-methylthioribose kinase
MGKPFFHTPETMTSDLIPELDIEQPDELLAYLRQTRRLQPGEIPAIIPLKGGVSNRTVLVERSDGSGFVVKQALEKLRVEADWHSNPDRSHREALGLAWLTRLAPPGTITPLLFEDSSHHLLAMEAVPQPHENWKSRLLAGGLEIDHVKQFGHLLGTIHRRARQQREELALVFDDRSFFDSLRIDPYYRHAAARNPESAHFFAALIAETEAARETLVHGDYSPKNILIRSDDTLVLLDHEVIHFGDPAFDLGFSLTHLLSKAHHLPPHREKFLEAAQIYWKTYHETAEDLASSPTFESLAVRHTLGCLLARVDGRSPLEYLNTGERDRQRAVVLAIIRAVPTSIVKTIEAFDQALGGYS